MTKDKEQSRRDFLKTSAKAAVIAPAAAVVLNASIPSANAIVGSNGNGIPGGTCDINPDICLDLDP